MKIVFYGTREYDHYYFDVLAADPEYGCEIRFLTANLDADTAPLARGGDAVCAFVNADCSASVLERLAQAGIRCLLLRSPARTYRESLPQCSPQSSMRYGRNGTASCKTCCRSSSAHTRERFPSSSSEENGRCSCGKRQNKRPSEAASPISF